MLANFLFILLFETIQPSYGTVLTLLPEEVAVHEYMKTPSLTQAAVPTKKSESIAPVIEARSVYSIDLASHSPLLTQDIFSRRPIASISKLMTAMVILDSHTLDEVLTVSHNASVQEGSRMWLFTGEKITVEAALTGLLVNSGNDAAVALAEFDSGSEGAFVKKMNAKAAALGLRDTHFSNAKGFDDAGNYSTAFDTMIFGRGALDYSVIRRIVQTKKGEVFSANGAAKHPLESTNQLLENPYFKVIGLKTGHTPASGESFVSLAQEPGGREILTVVLDSPDRFKETKIILDWIYRNYEFPPLVAHNQ